LSDPQTSSRGELIREDHLEEAIEKQREETTMNVLERWAEPLEQYLSTLQKFVSQISHLTHPSLSQLESSVCLICPFIYVMDL